MGHQMTELWDFQYQNLWDIQRKKYKVSNANILGH